jgi:hypothetical protein
VVAVLILTTLVCFGVMRLLHTSSPDRLTSRGLFFSRAQSDFSLHRY